MVCGDLHWIFTLPSTVHVWVLITSGLLKLAHRLSLVHYQVSAWHLSSYGTRWTASSRDAASPAYSSWLCIISLSIAHSIEQPSNSLLVLHFTSHSYEPGIPARCDTQIRLFTPFSIISRCCIRWSTWSHDASNCELIVAASRNQLRLYLTSFLCRIARQLFSPS